MSASLTESIFEVVFIILLRLKKIKFFLFEFAESIDGSLLYSWGWSGQSWMLDNVVVPVATYAGVQEEYAYLKTSIARFPLGEAFSIPGCCHISVLRRIDRGSHSSDIS